MLLNKVLILRLNSGKVQNPLVSLSLSLCSLLLLPLFLLLVQNLLVSVPEPVASSMALAGLCTSCPVYC